MYLNSYMKSGKKLSEMTEVERGKDMAPLLYDLLTTQSCSEFGEDKIIKLITDFIPTRTTLTNGGNFVTHEVDEKGNLFVRVGKQKKVHARNKWTSRVMFSCHLDTVDRSNKGLVRQLYSDDGWVQCGIVKPVRKLFIGDKEIDSNWELDKLVKEKCKVDFDNYTVFKGKLHGTDDTLYEEWTNLDIACEFKEFQELSKNVLGADDKLGCYIMCRMIAKGIPGLYVFHHGEESGGIGSHWVARNKPEYVKDIDYCIAFDRMNYGDVITSQSGGRCCSDEFADALCGELNRNLPPKQQMSKNSGTFTDSASYTSLIPECTNVSVGYKSQHTDSEKFDHEWLEHMLIPALLKVQWAELPVKRDPKAKETFGLGNYYGYGRRANTWRGMDDSYWDFPYDEDDEFRYSQSYKVPEQKSFKLGATDEGRKNQFKTIQSSVDRHRYAIDNMVPFDIADGFFTKESEEMKIERVLMTFDKADMSMRDIAKLVVEAYEADPEEMDF